MKSYTDIEQSKKLTKILSLKSADMCYMYLGAKDKEYQDFAICAPAMENDLPCWSLAALLKLIPNFNMYKRTIECRIETTNHLIDKAWDLVDAAFEMVCWLKENNEI